MKKVYIKPEIMFEDFTLSTNIAGDCEVKTNNPTSGECSYKMSGIDVFVTDVTGCTFPVLTEGGDGEYNGLCYHVPDGGVNNLFNS